MVGERVTPDTITATQCSDNADLKQCTEQSLSQRTSVCHFDKGVLAAIFAEVGLGWVRDYALNYTHVTLESRGMATWRHEGLRQN